MAVRITLQPMLFGNKSSVTRGGVFGVGAISGHMLNSAICWPNVGPSYLPFCETSKVFREQDLPSASAHFLKAFDPFLLKSPLIAGR